jgi:ribonuclease HI
MTKYYAVARGNKTGIFLNWNDCKEQVNGYKRAVYKKFETREEADHYIQLYSVNIVKSDMLEVDYYVYTDGSCHNNGRVNAKAGIGIFFGINDERNVSRKLEGKQSNNAAELTAIIETYDIIKNDILDCKKITIVSDSQYAINCALIYGKRATSCDQVKYMNNELVKTIYQLYKDKPNVKFQHVKAHTKNTDVHSIGNDNADKLANIAIGVVSV